MEDQQTISDRKEENRRYYLAHKEELIKRNVENTKIRRKQNPEKRKEYDQQKVQCHCGDVITRGALSNHKKSAKHKIKMT